MMAYHQSERARMDAGQKERQKRETRERAERMGKGFRGLWDRLTGEHAKIKKQNEMEAFFALGRDREQRHTLIQAQLRERQDLQQKILAARQHHAEQVRALHKDAANYRLMQRGEAPDLRQEHREAAPVRKRLTPHERLERLRRGETRAPDRGRDRDRDRGHVPDLGH